MKIFVTGGTGLLGSHFAKLATTEGAHVVALVRSNGNTAYLNSLGATLSPGSLQDVTSLASGMNASLPAIPAVTPRQG
jgi:uncharacterized protein YbjT (DUF2867 family)